jgi:zinc/manganese transport system substrate-binding protein
MGTRVSSHRRLAAGAVIAALGLLTAGCSSAAKSGTAASGTSQGSAKKIVAVGAENEYADVIGQIGGQYVSVTGIMSNPNTDPHTFEADPKVAQVVSAAQLIVQNGVGYDDFMTKIEQASSGSGRQVINVQKLLGLPDSTPNPHLWYKPTTMPAVAQAVATDLSTLDPAHKAYYAANAAAFEKSLGAYTSAVAALKAKYAGTAVATTEPVADYLLQAAGITNLTPWSFQADIMNGVDPSPQDVSLEKSLFTEHKVKAFVYNQQVTDSLTETLLTLAHQNGIPVVGVYETMPTPGYTYQTWMVAETSALTNAFAHGTSAPVL